MTMSMTENGISTTLGLGSEQSEALIIKDGRMTFQCTQYDYRHTDGRLFSCVAPTLEKARAKRDKWLAEGE